MISPLSAFVDTSSANTPLSSDDPALADILAVHIKAVFADYGGKVDEDD